MCHIRCRENYGITAASPENGAVIEKFEQKLRMYKSPLNQIKLRTVKNIFLNYLEEGWLFNRMIMMKLIMYWDILDSGGRERCDNYIGGNDLCMMINSEVTVIFFNRKFQETLQLK